MSDPTYRSYKAAVSDANWNKGPRQALSALVELKRPDGMKAWAHKKSGPVGHGAQHEFRRLGRDNYYIRLRRYVYANGKGWYVFIQYPKLLAPTMPVSLYEKAVL